VHGRGAGFRQAIATLLEKWIAIYGRRAGRRRR